MRESELHDHIYKRSASLALGRGELVVGPGDDGAVVRTPKGDLLVLTVDQLVEGRHYEPGTEPDLIARKAIARSVSDLAAMGARPVCSLGTGLLSPDDSDADALFDAMHRWANHWGCPLIGGDIATHADPSHPRTITVTCAGSMDDGHAPVLRSGAKPGDLLYLTGQVGGSFESGWHLRFEPRLEHGLWASTKGSGVHAMIDLSDGLGRDADRVARASGVRIEIDASRLPINHRCAGWRDACSSGEDYELLIAIDPNADIPTLEPGLIGPIGVCIESETPGAVIVDAYGREHPARDLGWDH